MKNNGKGQASIISNDYYHMIDRSFKSEKYRLLFNIAVFTGERWGAVCQLKVSDVYGDPLKRVPLTHIIYPGEIRKKLPSGQPAKSRYVKVSPRLETLLKAYEPPSDPTDGGWLFPSQKRKGQPIGIRGADIYLRKAIKAAGLEHLGFSTHSTRRTFITNISRQGASVAELKAITGHKTVQALLMYVDVDEKRTDNLVNNFAFA